MKAAKNALSQKKKIRLFFSGLNFDFLEYESPNGESNGTVQLNMGAKTLLSMCEMFSKIPQKRKLILLQIGIRTILIRKWEMIQLGLRIGEIMYTHLYYRFQKVGNQPQIFV